MTRRPTVLLADDHTIVTDGLSRILKDAGFEVVGAVRNGQRLIDAATGFSPTSSSPTSQCRGSRVSTCSLV